MANAARRLIQSGTPTEKLFALDIIANNNLTGFDAEINALASDRNESIAGRARRTRERLEERR